MKRLPPQQRSQSRFAVLGLLLACLAVFLWRVLSAVPAAPEPLPPPSMPCVHAGLEAALAEWSRTVQRPASRFPKSRKWIYYVNTGLGRGGFADRLNGVMASLIMAVHTGRALGIYWTSPAPLQDALRPTEYIPWAIASPPPASTVTFDCLNYYFTNCSKVHDAVLASREHHISLVANTNWLDGVLADPRFAHDVRARYSVLIAGVPATYASSFACLFQRLFTPTGTTLAMYTRALARLGDSKLNCVQLRLGLGGKQAWNDSESFLNMTLVARVAQRAKMSERALGNKVKLLATSDSAHALDVFLSAFDVGALVMDTRAGIMHIDRVHGSQYAREFSATLATFLLFAHCDAAIVTERSGFGRLGVWLKGSPRRSELDGFFFLALRASQVALGKAPLIRFCDSDDPLNDSGCSS